MPDISMCANEDCKRKFQCYRFTAIPSKRQSYMEFKPVWNGEKRFGCADFWSNNY